ncbi:nitroreductase family protein [Cohnella endophytica]|uniref:Nitroreductase family protein n=1 Tax=Cohnella endophytica TaxID=2419778 RepID=A0A494XU51_9BACL|nr:nitroreductase family protein [Cohnella endophytica]RKP51619.1 nitroreductase family protein [Cohnella endophytica]
MSTSTASSVDFLAAIKKRRSLYAISKQSPIPDSRIQEIVEEAVKHAPSSFNSQTGRTVVLFGQQHDRLWDITTEVLKAIVPPDQFQSTQDKMNSFRAGHGTVLFFEDFSVVESFQQKFASYQDRFPIWAQQSSGMIQLIVWTALEAEGLGATLQHYNPLIDEKVKAEWKLPESWQLIAQMPFGTPTASAGDKVFQPISERVKVFN